MRLERNPNWYGKHADHGLVGLPLLRRRRKRSTPALTSGDVDAVDDVPPAIYSQIVAGDVDNITAIGGNQGSFSELAMNSGCETGIGDGHVALKDPLVRQAINWSIDRDLLVEKVFNGLGTPAYAIIPSANPDFDLKLPSDVEQYTYNPDKAKELLDEAGWTDDDGNGVREKDGVELRLRYFDRSVGNAAGDHRVHHRLAQRRRHRHRRRDLRRRHARPRCRARASSICSHGAGCRSSIPIRSCPTSPPSACPRIRDAGGYNDANWCNAEYDALYEQQQPGARSGQARRSDPAGLLTISTQDAPYAVLYKYDELQAIRSDRWENLVQQPKDTGPCLFNNTSPGYIDARRRSRRRRRRRRQQHGPDHRHRRRVLLVIGGDRRRRAASDARTKTRRRSRVSRAA